MGFLYDIIQYHAIFPARVSYKILEQKVVSILYRFNWHHQTKGHYQRQRKRENIKKQKVVSSFGRLDWYDQGKARATLLAARTRGGGIFSPCSIREDSSQHTNNFWLLLSCSCTSLPRVRPGCAQSVPRVCS